MTCAPQCLTHLYATAFSGLHLADTTFDAFINLFFELAFLKVEPHNLNFNFPAKKNIFFLHYR